MSGTAEKSWSSPDDLEFQKKFKAFLLQRAIEYQEARTSPKTDPIDVPPSEESISLLLIDVPPIDVPPSEEPISLPPVGVSPSEKTTSLPPIHTLNSEEPPSIPPVGVVHVGPPAKSESTTATTDKKVDEGNLEARLGKKIDDAFALLDERLDKEFQLLHHIMVATWEGA
ncbi:hypothetical protein FPSE_07025 [Fusarium pseudograminearum CS3096]|uniref:Uncharacterized protein n=1 Tax=Fusarium pseudograminearum (strain CS3096) TaxID=1028729 RepID=K3VFM4_FUSPC|nr:hypothetical protein FPSE_07025 [Fusarium pseudograminearum CS3096]EKJ72759.1 hypothetical protein FPSE_07025 [Fusarium pseudograminearum CS3096]KAF0635073.1 hypothetical protein FPSE5266_07025 [Fusarium pseudograminearum]